METILLMKHEMLLALLLAIMLIMRISGERKNESLIPIFNFLFVVNCLAGWFFNSSGIIFDGMFQGNNLIAFEKNILNTATLIIFLSSAEWLKGQRHLSEYYMLVLTALLGMFLMISSANLLMLYLAIELSAIPVAALCNFNHNERRSSEAAMKMIFSSAFSSCILLMGISFIYGITGSLSYFEIAGFTASLASMGFDSLMTQPGLFLTGFIFFFAGIVFKLSVVPFHFWTADVYEGSPVAVTSFLSVVSKGAMVFVFVQLLHFVFAGMHLQWYLLLCIFSVITMIVGNLFAIRQDNIKRFLAFSSITQIGFILVGISGNPYDGLSSSIYFVLIYIFSNLAAFAIVSFISEATGKETIREYRGLASTNPVMAWSMAIALFSLAGIPPTAGFFGKIFLLTSGAAAGNYILITIAALNMIVSLYYYLRIIRAMFMDKGTDKIPVLQSGNSYRFAMIVCISGILLTGFIGTVYDYIYSLAGGN